MRPSGSTILTVIVKGSPDYWTWRPGQVPDRLALASCQAKDADRTRGRGRQVDLAVERCELIQTLERPDRGIPMRIAGFQGGFVRPRKAVLVTGARLSPSLPE